MKWHKLSRCRKCGNKPRLIESMRNQMGFLDFYECPARDFTVLSVGVRGNRFREYCPHDLYENRIDAQVKWNRKQNGFTTKPRCNTCNRLLKPDNFGLVCKWCRRKKDREQERQLKGMERK